MQGREKNNTQQAKHSHTASHSVRGWHLRYLKYSAWCYRGKQQDHFPSAVKDLMIYGFRFSVVFFFLWLWESMCSMAVLFVPFSPFQYNKFWRTINQPFLKDNLELPSNKLLPDPNCTNVCFVFFFPFANIWLLDVDLIHITHCGSADHVTRQLSSSWWIKGDLRCCLRIQCIDTGSAVQRGFNTQAIEDSNV